MQARTVTIVSAAMLATLASVFLVAKSTANRAGHHSSHSDLLHSTLTQYAAGC